ncbi:MAG: acyl-CoA desaturase [Chitinophagaceae bacterium]|nr:acyl-CoA desaturase [Chitinophagaceae bacterium]
MRKKIFFLKKDPLHFWCTVNERVNQYFSENNITKYGNKTLYLKTIVMVSILFIPYLFLVYFPVPFWIYIICSIVMGIGTAGVGMNVMHDGNHCSYSPKMWINKIMGGTIYILAGNVYNWQVQHNVLHHTYTNIHGHDEDLEGGIVIRFTKESPWYAFHRFQQYYFIFLYGLLTLNWATNSDFYQMSRYQQRNLFYKKSIPAQWEWTILVITKIIYFSVWILIPILAGIIWWKVLIGFFVMHYVAGIILSIVFQLAHVVNKTEHPMPSEGGEIDNAWAIHQLHTTANFATKNKILNYFTGGLNHQIEHHLFPNISHIHYTKLATIIQKTASECMLPYHEFYTLSDALYSHFQYLKKLGVKPT